MAIVNATAAMYPRKRKGRRKVVRQCPASWLYPTIMYAEAEGKRTEKAREIAVYFVGRKEPEMWSMTIEDFKAEYGTP